MPGKRKLYEYIPNRDLPDDINIWNWDLPNEDDLDEQNFEPQFLDLPNEDDFDEQNGDECFWFWDLPNDDDLYEQNCHEINWKSTNDAITIMTILFIRDERRKVIKN